MNPRPLCAAPVTALDHVVVLVRELAASAATWTRLGFTLSPRGEHSAVVGTANHTLMFERDYLELLVTQGETSVNADWRDMMAAGGEGLYGAVLATTDVDAVQAALTANGVTASAPLAFDRPVDMPGQAETRARFRVSWTAPGTVPGLKLFVCEHLTREAVWLPALQRHRNSTRGIRALHMQVPDLQAAGRHWSGVLGEGAVRPQVLLDAPACVTTEGATAWATVTLGGHRLWLVERAGVPPRVKSLHLQVASPAQCRDCLRDGGFSADESVGMMRVPDINGVDLVFAE